MPNEANSNMITADRNNERTGTEMLRPSLDGPGKRMTMQGQSLIEVNNTIKEENVTGTSM